MNKFTPFVALLCTLTAFSSCKKDENPIIEIPASAGSTLTLNGLIGNESGTSAGNSVFVDFSKDKQVSVARNSWDLGFYAGAEFRVILNHTLGATAIALDKTDLNTVTAADTITIATGATLALGQGQGGFSTIDPVTGLAAAYLSGTVIKEVSATEGANKVYIINRGGSDATDKRGWQKVRIIRNGNGYTLQYAKINETTFKTLNVAKDPAFNFNFISFNTGIVQIEPAKADWDIEWSLSTYLASPTIPYTFSDFVLTNFVGGVTAAEVIFNGAEANNTVNYTDFKEANLTGISFVASREAIAGKWRITSGTPVGVKTDRFYLIKDGTGNVYKLKFVSFHANDTGVRGKPVITYELVKKA